MKANKCTTIQHSSVANAQAAPQHERENLSQKQINLRCTQKIHYSHGVIKGRQRDLSNLKQNVVDTLSKTGLSKEKISRKYWQITQSSKNRQNKKQNTIIKFKAHSFKERNFFK